MLLPRSKYSFSFAAPEKESRQLFIQLILLTCLFALLTLGTVDLIAGQQVLPLIRFAAALVVGIDLLLLQRNKDMMGMHLAVLLAGAVVTSAEVLHGGRVGEWLPGLFCLPILLVFFLGTRWGLVANLVMFSVTYILLLWHPGGVFEYPVEILRSLPIYFALLCGQGVVIRMTLDRYRELVSRERQQMQTANQEMQRQSMTDALTGIWNRSYIETELPREYGDARRRGRSLAIALCDIDHFKQVNDTYGHYVGDEVLKAVANTISRNVRKEVDWVARYGGEELLLVLPGASLEAARTTIERIRTELEKQEIQADGHRLSVTASFGLTGFEPEDPGTRGAQALLKQADAFLYQAKREGRNRTRTPLDQAA